MRKQTEKLRDWKRIGKSFLSAAGLAVLLNVSSTSLWPCLLWYGIDCLYRERQESSRRERVCAGICAAFFSLCCVLRKLDVLTTFPQDTMRLFLLGIGMYWLFAWALEKLFKTLGRLESSPDWQRTQKTRGPRAYLAFTASLVLCYFPYWLNYYPAVVSYDCVQQMEQYLGLTPYINHHPVAHTLTMKLFHHYARLLTGNETAAYGVMSLVQLILLSLVFAAVLYELYRHCGVRWIWKAAWIFYALIPYQGTYSVTLWKDIWFGAFVLLFLLVFWQGLERPAHGAAAFGRAGALFILGLGICLFRGNGLYAFALFTAVSFCLFRRWRALPLVSAAALLCAAVITGPVYDAMGVQPTEAVEALSIPIQNIASVVAAGGELEPEEYELLERVTDVEQIPERYLSTVSDNMKNLILEQGGEPYLASHMGEFLKLWIRLGLRYPGQYLISWIDQTSGYWYPDVDYWVYGHDVYPDNPAGISRQSLLPAPLQKLVSYWSEMHHVIPFYGAFWAVGSFTWAMLVLFFYTVSRKKWRLLPVFGLLLGIWGTLLIATPVFAEFRYYYAVVAALPLYGMMTVRPSRAQ